MLCHVLDYVKITDSRQTFSILYHGSCFVTLRWLCSPVLLTSLSVSYTTDRALSHLLFIRVSHTLLIFQYPIPRIVLCHSRFQRLSNKECSNFQYPIPRIVLCHASKLITLVITIVSFQYPIPRIVLCHGKRGAIPGEDMDLSVSYTTDRALSLLPSRRYRWPYRSLSVSYTTDRALSLNLLAIASLRMTFLSVSYTTDRALSLI